MKTEFQIHLFIKKTINSVHITKHDHTTSKNEINWPNTTKNSYKMAKILVFSKINNLGTKRGQKWAKKLFVYISISLFP